jgi:hypothetical protein
MHALTWAFAALGVVLAYASSASPTVTRQPGKTPFVGVLDEHPAIRYAHRPTTEPVAQLAARIARGETTLEYALPAGYLNAVLRALDISPESQLLLFSKTALQRAHTSPKNPRALYYNDSVVVGYIPGARHLEIASHDVQQGTIFYTIDQAAPTAPALTARTNCLSCHVSGSTLEVPGPITRSNFTNANGEPIPQLGFQIVDHRTPISQRWGGWFVTGQYDLAPYGGVTHLGNVATAMHPQRDVAAGTSNEILHEWLRTDIEALGYPSHDSDIAALMIFDHQMRAMNLLTRFNWEGRVAEYDGTVDYTGGELKGLADEIADYFLFAGEAPPPARLTPRPGFAAQFTSKGPRDSRGRSLRELDLSTRLLKYGCSYMIYSPAFDALPAPARQAVYRRMRETLRDSAISEILRETKADWASTP